MIFSVLGGKSVPFIEKSEQRTYFVIPLKRLVYEYRGMRLNEYCRYAVQLYNDFFFSPT